MCGDRARTQGTSHPKLSPHSISAWSLTTHALRRGPHKAAAPGGGPCRTLQAAGCGGQPHGPDLSCVLLAGRVTLPQWARPRPSSMLSRSSLCASPPYHPTPSFSLLVSRTLPSPLAPLVSKTIGYRPVDGTLPYTQPRLPHSQSKSGRPHPARPRPPHCGQSIAPCGGRTGISVRSSG